MKKLQLPSSYAALSPEEQCAAFGGSEFGDAVGSFFDNLHFNDFFWNGGLISFTSEKSGTPWDLFCRRPAYAGSL